MYFLSLKNIFQSRDKLKISIIDSGVGGIVFANNLEKEIKDLDLVVNIDTEGFPYGQKDLNWLKERLELLISQAKSNVIIIACNTLSSLIYYYDLKFKKIVVDVITPTIYFLKDKKYKNICILCTKNTIKMDIYGKLLNSNIIYIDTTGLIDDIQNNKNHIINLYNVIDKIDDKCDLVILGCTHLIRIKDEFRKIIDIDILSQDEIFTNIFKI